MKIAKDITELVGKTPLVQINKVMGDDNFTVAKLEFFNPTSSVKDRAALEMVNEAERSGALKKGSTIIEATSGNTGISLAFIAAAREYKLVLVMPEAMSIERKRLLKYLGAHLELTSAHLGMKGSIDRANVLAGEIENSFLVKQFDNPANVEAHVKTTARELIEDTDKNIDYVFVATGTGGTVTGIAKVLKKELKDVKIIAIEPEGSAVLGGGNAGPHMIQGIGPGFIPSIMDVSLLDGIVSVGNEESYEYSKALAKEEGLIAGISCGATVAGAKKYIAENNIKNKNIVLIFMDSGERYTSIDRLMS
ncbi:MAG: cysteine synthase A [Planctomycetota bacterium]|nr:MAG: cysteine synthase A [Planctomycetota bacterium]